MDKTLHVVLFTIRISFPFVFADFPVLVKAPLGLLSCTVSQLQQRVESSTGARRPKLSIGSPWCTATCRQPRVQVPCTS